MINAKSGAAPEQPASLHLAAAGLCCSLGYHLDAAICALRANMDHFQESTFYSLSADPINVARLPDAIYGQARLQRWVEYAVRDCSRHLERPATVLDAEETAVIVLAPHHSRAHADADRIEKLVLTVLAALREELPPAQRPVHSIPFAIMVLSQGSVGLAPALSRAANYLVNETAKQVLLIGIDSLLNSADINFYLSDERLFVRGNSNGFLPGEAASAILLRLAPSSSPGLHIKGIGVAEEAGRHDGSVPSRGQGLTAAIRSACVQAKVDPLQLMFRISDQNGEQFFAKDAANAITRVMFGGRKMEQLSIADKIGEVSAASGPAMLAWLHRDMQEPDTSPGALGVLHLAHDDGTRCAIVLQHIQGA